jgi:hypothetical protein
VAGLKAKGSDIDDGLMTNVVEVRRFEAEELYLSHRVRIETLREYPAYPTFSVCKIVGKAWHYSPNHSTTQIVCKIDSNRNNSPQQPF